MLKDINAIKIPFTLGNKRMYLLNNLNSRLYMEHMTDYNALMEKTPAEWTTEDVLHYLRSLLIDSQYSFNESYIANGEYEKCRPTLAEIGRLIGDADVDDLIIKILTAISASMPAAPINEDDSSENFLMGGQMPIS